MQIIRPSKGSHRSVNFFCSHHDLFSKMNLILMFLFSPSAFVMYYFVIEWWLKYINVLKIESEAKTINPNNSHIKSISFGFHALADFLPSSLESRVLCLSSQLSNIVANMLLSRRYILDGLVNEWVLLRFYSHFSWSSEIFSSNQLDLVSPGL